MIKIGLVRDLDKDIPFDKVTVKLLKSLDYGRDIQLNDKFTISKHSEEDMIDIRHTETSEDLYSVSWDWDTDKDDSIEFEQVYHDKATYGRYNEIK
tara:strand:+ start:271 stop:558 length:288 start_codon:yes stop_codon:yes gene_type:complete